MTALDRLRADVGTSASDKPLFVEQNWPCEESNLTERDAQALIALVEAARELEAAFASPYGGMENLMRAVAAVAQALSPITYTAPTPEAGC